MKTKTYLLINDMVSPWFFNVVLTRGRSSKFWGYIEVPVILILSMYPFSATLSSNGWLEFVIPKFPPISRYFKFKLFATYGASISISLSDMLQLWMLILLIDVFITTYFPNCFMHFTSNTFRIITKSSIVLPDFLRDLNNVYAPIDVIWLHPRLFWTWCLFVSSLKEEISREVGNKKRKIIAHSKCLILLPWSLNSMHSIGIIRSVRFLCLYLFLHFVEKSKIATIKMIFINNESVGTYFCARLSCPLSSLFFLAPCSLFITPFGNIWFFSTFFNHFVLSIKCYFSS